MAFEYSYLITKNVKYGIIYVNISWCFDAVKSLIGESVNAKILAITKCGCFNIIERYIRYNVNFATFQEMYPKCLCNGSLHYLKYNSDIHAIMFMVHNNGVDVTELTGYCFFYIDYYTARKEWLNGINNSYDTIKQLESASTNGKYWDEQWIKMIMSEFKSIVERIAINALDSIDTVPVECSGKVDGFSADFTDDYKEKLAMHKIIAG
jgi:TRAP-type mannitol/chloroaromatic compound transport system permease small subunit